MRKKENIKNISNIQFLESDYNISNNDLGIKKDDLVVVGGRIGMGKRDFAYYLAAKNDKLKCCLYSLNNTKYFMKYFWEQELKNNWKNKKVDLKIIYKEYPGIIALAKSIVKNKNKYDFFMIHTLQRIKQKTNDLFDNDKNYLELLDFLAVLCKAIGKNIIVFSEISRKVETVKPKYRYLYYANEELGVKNLFVIHRPEYYGKKKYFYEKAAKNETFLNIAKCRSGFHQDIKYTNLSWMHKIDTNEDE